MPAARILSARLPRPRTSAVRLARRIPPRTYVTALAALALLVAGWMWLRDSPLVAASDITITGISGPDSMRIRAALEDAAGDMTTLHVRRGDLLTAVSQWPIVRDVQVQSHFPHRLDITVVEHVPVAQIVSSGRHVPVAADGTLLRGDVAEGVPLVPLRAPPAGNHLSDRHALAAVALVAAAPEALRERVATVWLGPRGLSARLRQGPVLYFGSGERLDAKWVAVTRVLADPTSAGASYLDTRVPERTVAGGLEGIPPPATTPGAPVTP